MSRPESEAEYAAFDQIGDQMSRRSDKFVESTFMRFEVTVNMPGFPEDDGEARAAEVKKALLDTARDFDMDANVRETTA